MIQARVDGQRRRAQQRDRGHAQEQAALVDTVGEAAAHHRAHEQRPQLRRAEETDGQRRAGLLEHLEGKGRGRDRGPEHGHRLPDPQATEVA